MAPRVLLVVHCIQDIGYTNRRVLHEMYASQFDALAFTISRTCSPDPAFHNIVQTWSYPEDTNVCPCGTRSLGAHSALLHLAHPRLVDVAAHVRHFDFVVVVEDDCLLSPRINPQAIGQRWSDWDVVMPTIAPCPRDHDQWVWTHHATGYPAFDRISWQLNPQQAQRHWCRYAGVDTDPRASEGLFYGFVDGMVFKAEFLRCLADELRLMREVWHEIAIPTAVMQLTSKVGQLDGLALWNQDRDRSLRQLLSGLRDHDFVHPIKPSHYRESELLRAYRELQSDSSNC